MIPIGMWTLLGRDVVLDVVEPGHPLHSVTLTGLFIALEAADNGDLKITIAGPRQLVEGEST
jgi:hypothetical protein